MAGSVKWMEYLAGDGQTYAARVDESNGELTGFGDVTDESTAQPLQRGLEMRYIIVREPATQAERKLWVGDPDNALFTGLAETVLLTLLGPTGLATALTAFQVVRAVGEAVTRSFAQDSGLQDGDAT